MQEGTLVPLWKGHERERAVPGIPSGQLETPTVLVFDINPIWVSSYPGDSCVKLSTRPPLNIFRIFKYLKMRNGARDRNLFYYE